MPGSYSSIDELLERHERIAALRAAGASVDAIAAEFNCNSEVMRQALIRMEDARTRVASAGWLAGLPQRAARALLSAGFASREQLRAAITDGSLTPSNTPQLGPRLFAGLLEWLAYEPPPRPDDEAVRRAIELLEGLGYRVTAPQR